MAHFSTSDAAVKAFEVMGRRPKPIIAWAVFYAAFSIFIAALNAQIAGPVMLAMETKQAAPMEIFRLFPWFAVCAVLFFAVWTIGYTAMIRAVLTPEDDRAFYLRLGGQELRQAGVLLAFTLMLLGVYFLLFMALLAVGFGGTVGGRPSAWSLAVIVALVLATVGAMVFVGVRLSLAMPITFVQGRVELFDSWSMTKGRFWPMFGAYLLAAVAVTLIYIVVMVLTAVIAFFAGGGFGGLISMFNTMPVGAAEVLRPLPLTLEIVTALMTTVTSFITVAPAAEIYRQLTAEKAPESEAS
ncbi:hypothetical protein P7B02_13220 [Caulobacter segnis]|uniref:hypothetical protein n=1 Tax=Caulobacter segnis TaxID=88688 RepID=UPI0024109C9F|nr:hypothetical protein [Caulobacter segnis]MDG2522506.1 hypothetical protein [Caulobacter segnis]